MPVISAILGREDPVLPDADMISDSKYHLLWQETFFLKGLLTDGAQQALHHHLPGCQGTSERRGCDGGCKHLIIILHLIIHHHHACC